MGDFPKDPSFHNSAEKPFGLKEFLEKNKELVSELLRFASKEADLVENPEDFDEGTWEKIKELNRIKFNPFRKELFEGLKSLPFGELKKTFELFPRRPGYLGDMASMIIIRKRLEAFDEGKQNPDTEADPKDWPPKERPDEISAAAGNFIWFITTYTNPKSSRFQEFKGNPPTDYYWSIAKETAQELGIDLETEFHEENCMVEGKYTLDAKQKAEKIAYRLFEKGINISPYR